MKYIETLREGERINEIYLCKFKQAALTKAGKPYDNVILQDKTGTLDAKVWEPSSGGISDFEKLDYISSAGLRVLLFAQKTMNSTQGSMKIRKVGEIIMEIFEVTGFQDILDIE